MPLLKQTAAVSGRPISSNEVARINAQIGFLPGIYQRRDEVSRWEAMFDLYGREADLNEKIAEDQANQANTAALITGAGTLATIGTGLLNYFGGKTPKPPTKPPTPTPTPTEIIPPLTPAQQDLAKGFDATGKQITESLTSGVTGAAADAAALGAAELAALKTGADITGSAGILPPPVDAPGFEAISGFPGGGTDFAADILTGTAFDLPAGAADLSAGFAQTGAQIAASNAAAEAGADAAATFADVGTGASSFANIAKGAGIQIVASQVGDIGSGPLTRALGFDTSDSTGEGARDLADLGLTVGTAFALGGPPAATAAFLVYGAGKAFETIAAGDFFGDVKSGFGLFGKTALQQRNEASKKARNTARAKVTEMIGPEKAKQFFAGQQAYQGLINDANQAYQEAVKSAYQTINVPGGSESVLRPGAVAPDKASFLAKIPSKEEFIPYYTDTGEGSFDQAVSGVGGTGEAGFYSFRTKQAEEKKADLEQRLQNLKTNPFRFIDVQAP